MEENGYWTFDKDYWSKIKTYMIIKKLHMVIFIIWGVEGNM